jgi:transcriptional regulator with XRE-family HTH domain
LQAAIGDRSLRTVAGITGVSASTLSNLVTGRTWGDVVTLARLEAALNVSLWGDEHLHVGDSNRPRNRKDRSGRHGVRSGRSDLTGPKSAHSGTD